MTEKVAMGRLRVMSDEELESEFNAHDQDHLTRQAILFERLRRISAAKPRGQSRGLLWAILVVALIGAALAGITAFPVIEGLFEQEWFDF